MEFINDPKEGAAIQDPLLKLPTRTHCVMVHRHPELQKIDPMAGSCYVNVARSFKAQQPDLLRPALLGLTEGLPGAHRTPRRHAVLRLFNVGRFSSRGEDTRVWRGGEAAGCDESRLLRTIHPK